MSTFVYIDETGQVGTSFEKQPLLQLAAVLVPEEHVMPLADRLRSLADDHLDGFPKDFEWHGQELWHGNGPWEGLSPPERLDAYADAIELLEEFDFSVAHSTIDKPKLHERHSGRADENAYRLALQFLLEKLDSKVGGLKVIVADETKEEQVYAEKMLMEMQQWQWGGEVSGKQLKTIIDSLHFVRSEASPGVQLADLVAYLLQRSRRGANHPNAQEALDSMMKTVREQLVTWREPWPT